MKQVCKCHGVSGSCTMKICWKVMPEFRVIGNELLKSYQRAAQIRDTAAKARVQKLKTIVNRRNRQISNMHEMRQKDQLVFIDNSPNFCKSSSHFDTLGTSGRTCSIVALTSQNSTSNFEASSNALCEHLCCGRGYYSVVTVTEEECDCQFQWCCSVKCKICKKKIVQYFCNWVKLLSFLFEKHLKYISLCFKCCMLI